MTKTRHQRREEILPKESNHWYVEQIEQAVKELIERAKPKDHRGFPNCSDGNDQALDEYHANLLTEINGRPRSGELIRMTRWRGGRRKGLT